MAAGITGRRGVIFQSERKRQDRYGLAEIVRLEKIVGPGWERQMRGLGSQHPVYAYMALVDAPYRSLPANAGATVEYRYEGFTDRLPEPVYELRRTMRQVPISAHPDFVSSIGGTANSPLNGAVFDELGGFVRFEGDDAVAAELDGVTDYLEPGAIWRQTSFAEARPQDMGQLGRRDNPPGNPPVRGLGSSEWFFSGLTMQQRGGVYSLVREWTLSGPRGVNTLIYG